MSGGVISIFSTNIVFIYVHNKNDQNQSEFNFFILLCHIMFCNFMIANYKNLTI